MNSLEPGKGFLVFTDLDGTLLDHHNYDFTPAIPALERLKALHVPIIPTTSKTAAEVLPLRSSMGLNDPFIVENGAAIYIPAQLADRNKQGLVKRGDYLAKSFAPDLADWSKFLQDMEKLFQGEFQAFSQMQPEQIVAATSLSESKAAMAMQRSFSDPLQWLGSEVRKTEFIKAALERGYGAMSGGRFLHLVPLVRDSNTEGSVQHLAYDKGQALIWLKRWFSAAYPDRDWFAIALGDSGNDAAMLEASDQAVLIRSDKPFPDIKRQSAMYYTEDKGPSGWREAIDKLI